MKALQKITSLQGQKIRAEVLLGAEKLRETRLQIAVQWISYYKDLLNLRHDRKRP